MAARLNNKTTAILIKAALCNAQLYLLVPAFKPECNPKYSNPKYSSPKFNSTTLFFYLKNAFYVDCIVWQLFLGTGDTLSPVNYYGSYKKDSA